MLVLIHPVYNIDDIDTYEDISVMLVSINHVYDIDDVIYQGYVDIESISAIWTADDLY